MKDFPLFMVQFMWALRYANIIYCIFKIFSHETELFLSHSVHVRVAMMIVKVANIFCPSSPVSSGSITDSVKQVRLG